MDAGIYKITNLINQKVYIGQSIRLQQRLREHRYLLKSNKHPNKHLQNNYNYYTRENFKFEVIKYIDNIKELSKWEEYYINKYSSYKSEFGFNATRIINEVSVYSNETKAKISKSHRGKKKSGNTSGEVNIAWLAKYNKYIIVLTFKGKAFELHSFKDIKEAILIRDLFCSYPEDKLEKMKIIFNQAKTPNGYFYVGKCKYKYKCVIRRKDHPHVYIGTFNSKEECALAYNQYVIDNNLDLPLNVVPFDTGIFEGTKWFCKLP